MRDEFERALSEAAAPFCVECGKCTAACPMAEMYPAFSWNLSPRGIVQQSLRGRELLNDQAVWCCTQCQACTRTCPAGVDCCGLVARLRPLAKRAAPRPDEDYSMVQGEGDGGSMRKISGTAFGDPKKPSRVAGAGVLLTSPKDPHAPRCYQALPARRRASSMTTSSWVATTLRSPRRSTSLRGSQPYSLAARFTG